MTARRERAILIGIVAAAAGLRLVRLGSTHSYRLPAKWIEGRGRSIHVVLFGKDRPGMTLDAFCVREARRLPFVSAP